MLDWLKSFFRQPRPAGPPRTLREFGPAEPLISAEGVEPDAGGWRVTASGDQTFRLFEVAEPGVEQCLLGYRAKLASPGVNKRAYLEMWCRFPGSGEYFSKGFHNAIQGAVNWSEYEIPFYLKRGQRPDLVRLNLVIEGGGRVDIRDVALLATPLQ